MTLHEPDIIQISEIASFWQQWLSKTLQMPSCEFLKHDKRFPHALCITCSCRKVTVRVGHALDACSESDLAPLRKMLEGGGMAPPTFLTEGPAPSPPPPPPPQLTGFNHYCMECC
jgi:hypothetical protein